MNVQKLKYGQKLQIGENIVVKVMRGKSGFELCEVKLCVEAPKHIPIYRDDIVKKKATDGEEEGLPKNP